MFFDGIPFVDETMLEHRLLPKFLDAFSFVQVVSLQFKNLFNGHFH